MNRIERLVVFAILMENGPGIKSKSPSYIWEKYQLAMTVPHPEELLDWNNKPKLKEWLEAWR